MVHDLNFEIKGVKTCLSWLTTYRWLGWPASGIRVVLQEWLWRALQSGIIPREAVFVFSCFFLHEKSVVIFWVEVMYDVCFFFNSGGGFGVDLFLIHLDEMIINDNDIGSYFVHIYIYLHTQYNTLYVLLPLFFPFRWWRYWDLQHSPKLWIGPVNPQECFGTVVVALCKQGAALKVSTAIHSLFGAEIFMEFTDLDDLDVCSPLRSWWLMWE